MSVENSVQVEVVVMEQTVSQLDGKAVMYELQTAITIRDGNLTPDEVRMQTRRKN